MCNIVQHFIILDTRVLDDDSWVGVGWFGMGDQTAKVISPPVGRGRGRIGIEGKGNEIQPKEERSKKDYLLGGPCLPLTCTQKKLEPPVGG